MATMTMVDRQVWSIDQELAAKYCAFEPLGSGGMGRVLRARHRQLKRSVAIKLLQQDLKASDAVTRFLREARAAAQIRSHHVAQVMDAGVLVSGQPYIVMEYLEGQDLAQILTTQGRLPVEQAVDYLLQALHAIAEAHSLDIIHRDIKPGNLFLARVAGSELIKVLDFGLAKTSFALDTLDPGVTEKGAMLGTPSFMAPEQYVDAQDVDVRADIWGLGATLFALVTGVAPFTGSNLAQIYTAVMHRPVPSLRQWELPGALDAVVATCLSRDRAARYADVGLLACALEPFGSAHAREAVERIQRVLSAERRASELWDPSAENVLQVAAPGTQRGVVSTTFARESRRPTAAAVRVWQRALWWLLGVATLFGLGGLLWTRPYAAAPYDSLTPTTTGVDTSNARLEVPTPPAPSSTAAGSPAPSVAPVEALPVTVPPARPQSRRSHSPARKSGAARADERSIYERYP